MTCMICKEKINSSYIIIEKNKKKYIICKKCFKKLNKCYICEAYIIPINNFVLIQGEKICKECYKNVKICNLCKKIIKDKIYYYKDKKIYFCSKCIKNEKCSICQLPITKKDKLTIENKKIVCKKCFNKLIIEKIQVQKIYSNIIKPLLEKKFQIKLPLAPNFYIKNEKEFKNIYKKNKKSILEPYSENIMGFILKINNNYSIYLKSYLTKSQCIHVITHECIHLWQFLNIKDIQRKNIMYIEGFAEWIAYETLLTLNHKEEAELITKQKGIYGKGFKKVLKLKNKLKGNQTLQFFKLIEKYF